MFVPKTFKRGIIVHNENFDLTEALSVTTNKKSQLALACLDSYFTLTGEPVKPGFYRVTVRRCLRDLPMFKVEYTETLVPKAA